MLEQKVFKKVVQGRLFELNNRNATLEYWPPINVLALPSEARPLPPLNNVTVFRECYETSIV